MCVSVEFYMTTVFVHSGIIEDNTNTSILTVLNSSSIVSTLSERSGVQLRLFQLNDKDFLGSRQLGEFNSSCSR